jgi:hypothetical protein
MGALPQVIKIIFEVKGKRNIEKKTRKISFPIYKTSFFSFFSLFQPLLLSNLVSFLFFIDFQRLKML